MRTQPISKRIIHIDYHHSNSIVVSSWISVNGQWKYYLDTPRKIEVSGADEIRGGPTFEVVVPADYGEIRITTTGWEPDAVDGCFGSSLTRKILETEAVRCAADANDQIGVIDKVHLPAHGFGIVLSIEICMPRIVLSVGSIATQTHTYLLLTLSSVSSIMNSLIFFLLCNISYSQFIKCCSKFRSYMTTRK
jgi:hypothetical protein